MFHCHLKCLISFISIFKASDNEREKAEPILQSSTSGKSKKKKKKKKKQGEEANSPSQVNGARSGLSENKFMRNSQNQFTFVT